MKTINKQPENMGGVLRIWAIPRTDISVSANLVTILSDQNIVDIYLKEDSASFSEEMTSTFAGTGYKTDLTAIVPCDTDETAKLISDMERRSRYLVIYIDGNGNYKLAGTTKVPLRFSATATTGLGTSGLNHYSISFTGFQRKRAIFIENPFA
jgi:hypothetical protein